MSAISVTANLLGVPQFLRDGQTVEIPPASVSLLAFLLLHAEREVPRVHLLEVFGSRGPEPSTRRRLNTALWRLRRSIEADPETMIVSTARGIKIAADCTLSIDVTDFESKCTTGRMVKDWSEEDAESVRRSLELYSGEFLAGHYDDWALSERTRLADLHLAAVLRLARWHMLRDESGVALHYAQSAVDIDPLREDLQRMLMRLYREVELPEMAEHQYGVFRSMLLEELGAEPLPETRQAGLGYGRSAPTARNSNFAVREALSDFERLSKQLRVITGQVEDSVAALRKIVGSGADS
jgi:DNA-binding SARP family transcriptional activator